MTHLMTQRQNASQAPTTAPAVLDVLEAAWRDERDLYRVLLTGRRTRVRGRVWFLSGTHSSGAPVGPQLIWDYHRYRSVAAAGKDCARLIEEQQQWHAGGRPAAVTWINRVRGGRRFERPADPDRKGRRA